MLCPLFHVLKNWNNHKNVDPVIPVFLQKQHPMNEMHMQNVNVKTIDGWKDGRTMWKGIPSPISPIQQQFAGGIKISTGGKQQEN